MMRQILVPGLVLLAVQLAIGDEYWIAYEGNDFPESEGWTRVHGEIPAERWIEDGALVIDSRADVSIFDFVKMAFDGTLDPDPGEMFLMRWRLKVDQVEGFYDPIIAVTSDEVAPDEFYSVGFGFQEDRVLSAFEPNVSAVFEPGVFHEYELRSFDMRSYRLYIDDDLAIEGVFYEVFGPTRVGWGDGVQGAVSLSRWDYVRFGVVPEPTIAILMAQLFYMSATRRSYT